MIRDSGKRSATEPPERQNPLISEDPLKIEILEDGGSGYQTNNAENLDLDIDLVYKPVPNVG